MTIWLWGIHSSHNHFPAQSGNAPFWGCAGDLVEMVVKVHCGTVLGNAFSTWPQMRPPKQSHNAVIALWQPGCSLSIGDRRIIHLLHWILRLMFGSPRRFFIQTWSHFQNILRWRYIFLRLLKFLMKTLDNRSPAQTQSGEKPIKEATASSKQSHGANRQCTTSKWPVRRGLC